MAKRKYKSKRKYTPEQKKSWLSGFFAGLFKGKKQKSKPAKSSKKTKNEAKEVRDYGFLAFNENSDVFNVEASGTSRSDALRNARKYLKRDPELPEWGVTITNDKSDENFYRKVTVYENGKIYDNWRSNYDSRDEAIRAKYPDLSKPVKK